MRSGAAFIQPANQLGNASASGESPASTFGVKPPDGTLAASLSCRIRSGFNARDAASLPPVSQHTANKQAHEQPANQSAWNIIKGKRTQKWAKLTDDDLQYAEGKKDGLIGRIRKRTGESRDAVEKALRESDPKNRC